MTDRSRLHRAILLDPADDLARLAYADSLEEAGEDAKAEFIRAQVALPLTRSLCGSEQGDFLCRSIDCPTCPLIRRQNAAWLAMPCASIVGQPFRPTLYAGQEAAPPCAHVRRGFVCAVQCPLRTWLDHGAALVATHPVERVEISDKTPYFQPDPSVTPTPPPAEWDAMWPARLGQGESRWSLTDEIQALLPHKYFSFRDFSDAETPEGAARAALSLACLNLFRPAAGLPLLATPTLAEAAR